MDFDVWILIWMKGLHFRRLYEGIDGADTVDDLLQILYKKHKYKIV